MMTSKACVFLALLGLTACGTAATTSDTSSAASSGSAPESQDPPGIPGCKRSLIEPDFQAGGAFTGPGIDGATGKLRPLPASAYMSSTYLALKLDDASHKRFSQLSTPVVGILPKTPGLLAFAFGTSASCATARTFSIWQDEATMVKFSLTPEHSAAASAIGEISRGGSNITAWATTRVEDARWEVAAIQLGEDTGPFL